jgi:hypothetical protein
MELNVHIFCDYMNDGWFYNDINGHKINRI